MKHKWETDEEDVAADVTDSSHSGTEEGEATVALSVGAGQVDDDGHYKGSKVRRVGADFEEDISNRKANTKSVNTRRVQKPD